MPRLVLYSPDEKKRWEVSVPADRFEIGRSRDAAVCIPHASVSKRHALVERRAEGRYFYRDLGSRNGIELNGIRLHRGELEDGDKLRVGNVLITFYCNEAPREPVAPSTAPADATPTAATPAAPSDFDLDGAANALLAAQTLALTTPEEAGDIRPPPRAPARVARTPARGPRHPSAAVVVAGAAACIALGVAIGFLGNWAERAPDPAGAGTAPAAAPPPAEPVSIAPGPPPLGGPASSDAETTLRLCVRLCLDFWGRPPLDAELVKLAGLSREDLWIEIASGASGGRPPDLEPLPEAFHRLMGRAPAPEEHAGLLAEARADPAHYLFRVGTSAQYAQPSHRRPRSEEMLARSLLVDMTGTLPGAARVGETRQALKAGSGMVPTLARNLSRAGGGFAPGPGPGDDAAMWVQRAYARLLVRAPSPGETQAALKALGSPEGWRTLLTDLACRDEYRSY